MGLCVFGLKGAQMMNSSSRRAALLVAMLASEAAAQQPAMPAKTADPNPVMLTLEDQFDRRPGLADLRGRIVVLVYGDRKGTDACRSLGEKLHVHWHPTAQGQPPAAAQTAPVAALANVPPGQPSPDVRVVPVACCGKVPSPVRSAIRSQIAKGSPDVPVWLDFTDTMKGTFGLAAGEPNVVVFDAAGRLRLKITGTPDRPAIDKLVQTVEALRYEAAGVR
jgi:hypothetical protein